MKNKWLWLWIGVVALWQALPVIVGQGAPSSDAISMPGPVILTYANPNNKTRRYVPPPSEFRRNRPTAVITVNFIGTWDPQAQAAFQYAADIWAASVVSSVPIVVNAEWAALPSGVLGSAGATSVYRNFSGAPLSGTWYPVAMANAIVGSDLNGGSPEIQAQFSSAFPNWYFGTDGQTPLNRYDFVTVVLHELGHGLGFAGSMTVDDGSGNSECTGVAGIGCWGFGTGYPMVYDRFTENGSGTTLLSFPNNSSQLTAQLTSGNVFFKDGGQRYELYAPSTWVQGSSYSHLGESYNGTPNALMTYSVGQGEAIHDPGAVARNMFNRMRNGVYVATPTPTPSASPGVTTSPTVTSSPTFSPTPTLTPGTPTPAPTRWTYLPLVLHQQVIATPTPTPLPADNWLGYLNGLRAIGGLPAVSENVTWSNGCTLHSLYMVKTDTIAHAEDANSPWYTAEGDAAARNSNLVVFSSVGVIDTAALDLWMLGPFHGVGMIDAALQRVGFGSYREATGTWQMGACLDVLRGRDGIPAGVTFPLMWPQDGERLPYTSNTLNESPDPLTSCPGYSTPVGPPIYLLLGPGSSVTPNVTASSLKQGNTTLEHCMIDSSTYTNPDSASQDLGRAILAMRDAVVLLPRQPLTAGATYTVSITANGQTYTWQFTVQAGALRSLNQWQEIPAQIR